MGSSRPEMGRRASRCDGLGITRRYVVRKSAIGLAVVAGLLLVLGPADVFAGGKRKTPSASKILLESYKNFVKSKNYLLK